MDLNNIQTIIAGIGLVGLAVYQASQGEFQAAIQSGLAALAALGLWQAAARQEQLLTAHQTHLKFIAEKQNTQQSPQDAP